MPYIFKSEVQQRYYIIKMEKKTKMEIATITVDKSMYAGEQWNKNTRFSAGI
jgi:hypothetical protein